MAKLLAKGVAARISKRVPVAMRHYAIATSDNFVRAASEANAKCGSAGGSNFGSITSGTDSVIRPNDEPKYAEKPLKCGFLKVAEVVKRNPRKLPD